MHEYKVITDRIKDYPDFKPSDLEASLNEHALSGWKVVTCFTDSTVWHETTVTTILERQSNYTTKS
ncbi:MAG: DUF4177 domain-containing protein [Arthrobacter sp.]|uniref:DUF4177 domain-containing protein n=1 Tax=unclassified Arthrobacter TaxID=235627 RepID=UPI0026509E1C|nr:DUF4177 domain-containing protein [Micrococcaceae bacterium]MDN5813373.1 DUF4177 domain-containing protein [Micrococcaceae bacterium]MDN5823875.1 DUF4177 domain-containing protein [Micrococcaceae bacterium]MDN5878533.1 DUF4177 domain-containing protein [Micrococcaceae bacterium]MDN5886374.1 DUF4177 domain-containing protein [Micrococcaceae bacterium]